MENFVLEQLRKCGDYVYINEPYINAGGCAVYASIIGQALIDVHGLDVQCVVGDRLNRRPTRTLDYIENNFSPASVWDWFTLRVDFSHVLIEFKLNGQTYVHDSRSLVKGPLTRDPTMGFPLLKGHVSVAHMAKLASQQDGWNDMFPRRTGIPLVKKAAKMFITKEASSVPLVQTLAMAS